MRRRYREREGDAEEIAFRAMELDGQSLRSEFGAAQSKMPSIFFAMCLDIIQAVIGIFELSLDQKIRKIICVFLPSNMLW